MASTKEYRDYVIEELSIIDEITYKPMMGEFLLYYNGLLFFITHISCNLSQSDFIFFFTSALYSIRN